jgi:c-di-GMP-binding flagellar brake protein YcgR
MNFTESRLAETISALQKLSASHDWGDNRRAKRMELRIPIPIRAISEDGKSKTIQAELRDISARGLALLIRQPLEDGSTFLIQLPVEDHDYPVAPLICQVIHCRDNKDDSYKIGAEFIGQADTSKKDAGQQAKEEQRIRNSVLS